LRPYNHSGHIFFEEKFAVTHQACRLRLKLKIRFKTLKSWSGFPFVD